MGGVVVLLVVIVLVLWVLASCIRIVPQAYAVVLERLGAYKATWSTGIHFKVPFIERVARRVNLKEQVVDFPPQPVITKDNVTMQIDTVVFFQITDPKLYAYGVENPIMAIENLSATTLRNIIGDMELDETLRLSIPRCVRPLMWLQIHGESRLTVWSLRTSFLRQPFRMPWRNR